MKPRIVPTHLLGHREISVAELKRIRRSAIYTATKLGYASEAEDFAQVVLWRAARKPLTASMDKMLIDYLRVGSGRKKSPNYRQRQEINRYAASLDAPIDEDGPALFHEIIEGPKIASDNPEFFEQILKPLRTDNRAMLVLWAKWGMTMEEIGYAFGITEAAVSQRIKKLSAVIRKEIAALALLALLTSCAHAPCAGGREEIAEARQVQTVRGKPSTIQTWRKVWICPATK